MKLEPGKSSYSIPAMIRLESFVLQVVSDDGQTHYADLWQIDLARLIANRDEARKKLGLQQEPRAIPTCFAINGRYIEFWPAPDKPYVVTGRYYPPMQEF